MPGRERAHQHNGTSADRRRLSSFGQTGWNNRKAGYAHRARGVRPVGLVAPPACPFAVACTRGGRKRKLPWLVPSPLPSPPPLSPAAHTHDAVALCSRRSRRRHVWAASHAPPNQCRHTWARHARIKYSYSSSYYYVSTGYSVASSSRRHTLACDVPRFSSSEA